MPCLGFEAMEGTGFEPYILTRPTSSELFLVGFSGFAEAPSPTQLDPLGSGPQAKVEFTRSFLKTGVPYRDRREI